MNTDYKPTEQPLTAEQAKALQDWLDDRADRLARTIQSVRQHQGRA